MPKPVFELNGRIWLEVNGVKMLGHGRVELLERIQLLAFLNMLTDSSFIKDPGFSNPFTIAKSR